KHFFEVAHELDDAHGLARRTLRWKSAQVENRVGNQLSRTVERHVTTPIAFENLDPALRERLRRRHDVLRMRIAPERDHGSVLEQKQHVSYPSLFAKFDQAFLQAQAGRVINRAELENRNHQIIYELANFRITEFQKRSRSHRKIRQFPN